MRALFALLGGAAEDASSALQLVEASGPGRLYRCSDGFVQLMADATRHLGSLAEEDDAHGERHLPRFQAEYDRLDAEWMATGKWHKGQVSTFNRLGRLGWARVAQEKAQPLFCWYGEPVPEYVIVRGEGPYPGPILERRSIAPHFSSPKDGHD